MSARHGGANREARRLHEQFTSEQEQNRFQARVTEMLAEAAGLMSRRRYPEAVELLEFATRLDISDETVQTRLEEAKSRQNASCEPTG